MVLGKGDRVECVRHTIRELIHIHLVEPRGRVAVGKFDDFGGDDFAGSTPGCHAVDNHQGGVFEGGCEVGFPVEREKNVSR